MLFLSAEFFILFAICYILYFIIPTKIRNLFLLAVSGIFIGYNNWLFLSIALVISLFTYGAGLLIEKSKSQYSFYLLLGSILGLVSTWISFRYSSSLLFPLGISFYTFQAIGYLVDIYWKEIKAERNVIDFSLYMLFFMKFLSGPIERGADLLSQLKQPKCFSYDNAANGLKLVALGLFKKLIVTNHIAPYTEVMYGSIHELSGIQLLVTFLLYPIELYADFSGYTDMAIGGARMLGIRLSPNFNRPFIALTTADFWRRWHISLSSWVRDYLYNPLMFEFRNAGQWGILLSLTVTFVTFGVWHGAGWTFVVYGLLQALIIFYETKVTFLRDHLPRIIGQKSTHVVMILRTYFLFALSLVFFRVENLSDAFHFISHISFTPHADWTEMNIGMPDHNCIVAGTAIVLMFLFEHFNERMDLDQWFKKQSPVFRWFCYYVLVFLIFLMGKFETENFIYFQF